MAEDKHFLDKHRVELIQRVNNTAAILDELLSENVIQQNNYDEIRALPTSQEIMRELFNQLLASSGIQGKETFYKILNKHESYLIDDLKRTEYENPIKVETLMAKRMLHETLNDLRMGELDYFKSLIELEKDYPPISRSRLKVANAQDTVELMVETYREECVELTKKVLKKMNRADLVQRLSDTSSGSKEKKRPSPIRKVEAMTSVIELLLETLADLRDVELWVFQSSLCQTHSSNIQWSLLMTADMQDKVFFMVLIEGQQSVETTKNILEKMNRTDLVQMLSDSSSGSKKKHSVDEHLSALIHKVATMRAVKELLLETFSDLRDDELEKFKVLLQFTFFQRSLELISWEELSLPNTSWSELSPLHAASGELSLPDTSWSKWNSSLSYSGELSPPHTSWSELSPLHAASGELSPPHTSWSKWNSSLSYSGELSPPHTSWSKRGPSLSSSGEVSSPHTSWRSTLLQPSFLFASRRRQINTKDRLVDMMLKKCGQQSVEVTMEVLTDMNRTDLMERLSETSSGHKAAGSSAEAFGVSTTQGEKHCVDEHWPALIQKVETMTSVIELLLETLAGLSDWELEILKSVLQTQTKRHRCFLYSTLIPLKIEDTVFLMVLTYGQQSVEKTEEVLKKMTKTDLVQRLSHSSSQSKKKRLDEHRSALIQKVATMAVVKQLLLETLNSLSDKELEEFKQFLMWTIRQKTLKAMSSPISFTKDREEIVDLMLQTYSQQSVSLTREAVKKMNRTDLMQKLSKPSSEHEEKHSVDEHQTALLEKAAVKQILLETLKDLSSEELKKIKWLLQFTQFQKGLPRTSWKQLYCADSTKELVNLMVQTCGQQSVEVTKEVFMDMNRTDLVKKLSVISSRIREKHPSERLQKVVTMTSLMDKLFETLKDLSYEELEEFKDVLQHPKVKKGLPKTGQRMETVDADEIAELMVEIYGKQSVEVARRVFMQMNRTDLVERLSEVSSDALRKYWKKKPREAIAEGPSQVSPPLAEEWLTAYRPRRRKKGFLSEFATSQAASSSTAGFSTPPHYLTTSSETQPESGPSGSSELEGCGSVTQDSSDWNKLVPEVNCTDADEAPTYSLQSEAGNFECSVSGMRWVCKEKVSFKYQFCSLNGHMEKIESMQYMPAGPLMDITAIAGKLDVVYLPHWIAIDDSPTLLDKFAVLHIDDCGDVVETVSEVTSSHVKLSEPVFSLKLILVKYLGLSVEIHCKVLIYKADTPSLRLHVYLIPPDPALIRELERTLSPGGYKRIQKPHPVKPLKMHEWFTLTAVLDGAKICPEALMLTYESTEPNFFQVLCNKNTDTDFALQLKQKNELQPVWTCEVQKDEWQSTGHIQEKQSVNKHQRAAITVEGKKLLNMLCELRNEEFKTFKWHLQCITESQRENSDRVDVVTLMLQSYTQEESVKVAKVILEGIRRNDLVQLLSAEDQDQNYVAAAGSSALASGVDTMEGGSGSAAEAEEGSRGCHQEQD